MKTQSCSECRTTLKADKICGDYFNEMLAWDFTDSIIFGKVHHLTVLCYYLQHPSNYSEEGLRKAIQILKNVVENNLSDKDLYKLESGAFSSSKRKWKINGTPEHHGLYSPEIKWTVTASDVMKDGIVKYPENVKEWSLTIYNDFKASGNLA